MFSETMVKSEKSSAAGGIRHVKVIDSEAELCKAYNDFAFYHTSNAIDRYENASQRVHVRLLKVLFLQLACRKREVIQKLKMYPSTPQVLATSARKSYANYFKGVELSPHMTVADAFKFAYGKETATLALYEKMVGASNLFSIKHLFDYLIASEHEHILYLDSQLSITNGDLDRPAVAFLEPEYEACCLLAGPCED